VSTPRDPKSGTRGRYTRVSTCYYFEFSQNGKILIARYPRTTIAKLHLRGTADASMSALGHRRTFAVHSRMSALPPLVDERRQPISFYKITSVVYEKISHSAKGQKKRWGKLWGKQIEGAQRKPCKQARQGYGLQKLLVAPNTRMQFQKPLYKRLPGARTLTSGE
jgi:hypothetical protein